MARYLHVYVFFHVYFKTSCYTIDSAYPPLDSPDAKLAIQARLGSWAQIVTDLNAVTKPSPTQDIYQEPIFHPEICGTTPGLEMTSFMRIVGGEEAKQGSAPWQVGLIILPAEGDNSVIASITCGGTLLTAHAFVTAAHCMMLPVSRYEAILGRHSSNLQLKECNQQRFKVVRYVKHPNFEPNTLKNDIAIVTIQTTYGQAAQFSAWILPACVGRLPDLYSVGKEGIVTGWGLLGENEDLAVIPLQQVKITVFSDSKCDSSYHNLVSINSTTQFCAGSDNGRRDACSGDSGGPFTKVVRYNSSDRVYLAGIVSFGMGCARADYPGVYTKLVSFLSWVEEVVRATSPANQNNYVGGSVTFLPPVATPSTTTTTTRTTTTTTTVTTTTTTTTTTAIPVAAELRKVGPICEGTYRLLLCSGYNEVIRVQTVFMGRKSPVTCDPNFAGRAASFGPNGPTYTCDNYRALQDIRSLCDSKRYCYINTNPKIRNGPFSDDTCQSVKPYVEVEFTCELGYSTSYEIRR